MEPVDDPAATVRVVPARTPFWELVMLTAAPPAGAGPLSVTVAVVGLPPTMMLGEREIAVTVGGALEAGLTVNDAEADPPSADAVSVTPVEEDTEFVGMENDALVRPEVTVSVVAAATAVFEPVSETLTPA